MPSLIRVLPLGSLLRIRDAVAVEILRKRFLILPNDLAGGRIDFDDTRKWKHLVQAMGSVIKDEDIAVRQECGRMLAGYVRRADLPDHTA